MKSNPCAIDKTDDVVSTEIRARTGLYAEEVRTVKAAQESSRNTHFPSLGPVGGAEKTFRFQSPCLVPKPSRFRRESPVTTEQRLSVHEIRVNPPSQAQGSLPASSNQQLPLNFYISL